MDAKPIFTDSDISSLKEAKEALHRIDCWAVTCPTCPLHIEVKHGCMCLTNYLGYIASKAEKKEGVIMDTIVRFTDSDIKQLKEAKDALHKIDCITTPCNVCPLYLDEIKGCIVKYLGCVAHKAEIERSTANDN